MRHDAPLPYVYAIKTAVSDPFATSRTFPAQKTMYGGKRIAAGDTTFVFAGENEGGCGLIARGVVTAAEPTLKLPGVQGQTRRVSVAVKRIGTAKGRLGRDELKVSENGQTAGPRRS